MPLSKLRLLGRVAAIGGLCWIVFAVAAVLTSHAESTRPVLSTMTDYLGFGLFALCLALAVPALLALHLHQRGADGRLGRAGALLAMAGAAGQSIVILGIVVNGQETSWFGLAAPIAILTWVVGSVVLGIAIRRARLMPPWVAIALPVATLFAIVGADYGTSVFIGAFQIVVGLRIAGAAEAGTPARGTLGHADARA